MPRGAGRKREEEYRELKKEFEESGKYKGREEEVTARIVNKQRARFGETRAAKEEDRKGESPDRGLPLENYDHLTVDQVVGKLDSLSQADVHRLKSYEQEHKKRKTLIARMDRKR